MHPLARKLLLAITAATVAGLIAWFAWERRTVPPAPTVELVDNTRELSELLRSRAASERPPTSTSAEPPPGAPSATATPAGYPPPLLRERITKEQARHFYGALKTPRQHRFQRNAHLWPLANQRAQRPFAEHPAGGWELRTNARGLRKDVEVRAEPPDLRVLVVGDSHTAGLVPNSESYANVLEVLLAERDPERSFEVLNAGVGGTHVYNYLGVLEFLEEELRPDVLVVGLYGGNDFQGLMALNRFYHNRGAPQFGPHGGSSLRDLPARGVVAQVLGQVAYFLDNPEDVEHARRAVDSITVEIARRCRASGIALVFVYIPPATSAQPLLYDHLLDEPLRALGMTREQLKLTDQLAEHWLTFLEERGLTCVDLTAAFSGAEQSCYWFEDLHINTRAHRIVAELLEPLVRGLAR